MPRLCVLPCFGSLRLFGRPFIMASGTKRTETDLDIEALPDLSSQFPFRVPSCQLVVSPQLGESAPDNSSPTSPKLCDANVNLKLELGAESWELGTGTGNWEQIPDTLPE